MAQLDVESSAFPSLCRVNGELDSRFRGMLLKELVGKELLQVKSQGLPAYFWHWALPVNSQLTSFTKAVPETVSSINHFKPTDILCSLLFPAPLTLTMDACSRHTLHAISRVTGRHEAAW